MHISILTLFPHMLKAVLDESIIKRAQDASLVSFSLIDMRTFATDNHKSVDDKPYGGGQGMLLRVDIVHKAILHAKQSIPAKHPHIVLLSPRGESYDQAMATRLTRHKHLILICGHYEGVDERVSAFIDSEISIGDYVLTGGEIPALVVADSVVRLLPGVLQDKHSTHDESFSLTGDHGERLLEYPQYTRPQTYMNMSVPDVLLSGNHKKIDQWRKTQSAAVTKKRREDLLKR